MPQGQTKHQLREDAEAFDRGQAFLEWLGGLARADGDAAKAALCERNANVLADLAVIYRTARESI